MTSGKVPWDALLMKAAGTAMVVAALIRLPEVFRAIFQALATLIHTAISDQSGEIAAVAGKLQMQMLSAALGDLVAFVVLLFLARWIFGYPAVLRKQLERISMEDPPRSEKF